MPLNNCESHSPALWMINTNWELSWLSDRHNFSHLTPLDLMWGTAERRTQQCSSPHCFVMYTDVFLFLTFLFNPRQESELKNSWCKPSLEAGKQWETFSCWKARFSFLFVQSLREEKLEERKFLSFIQRSLELLIPSAITWEHPYDLTSRISWIILQCKCEWTVSKLFHTNMVALFYSWSMGRRRDWASCPNPNKKSAITPGMESLHLIYSHYFFCRPIPSQQNTSF